MCMQQMPCTCLHRRETLLEPHQNVHRALGRVTHPCHTQGNKLHISYSPICPSLLPQCPGLGQSYQAQEEKSAGLRCFQNIPYLTPGKASKRKGHLSQHLIGEAFSLSMLLLERAATPNTPLKVIF